MTRNHKTERQYTFSLEEMQWLRTTQYLAERRAKVKMAKFPDWDPKYTATVEDVVDFGRVLRELPKNESSGSATTLAIKLGVVFWLNSVWQRMYNLPPTRYKQIDGYAAFTRDDIYSMHLKLLKDYIDNAF